MSVHKRGNSYFVRYRDAAGKQRNKHFGVGLRGKDKAEVFDLEVKLAKKKRKSAILISGSAMYLEELFELYIKDYVLRGQSKKQAESLKSHFKKKVFLHLPSKPVDELTYKHVMDFIERYPNKSQSTINNWLAYLSSVFNFGIRHGYMEVNPLQHWKKKKVPPRRFEINLDELGKLLKHSPPHLKLAILVTYYTGVRPGVTELFAMKWDDVDFERDEIRIFRSKTNNYGVIPISQALRPILKRAKRKAKTDHVIERNGKPINRVTTSLQNALKKAGITKPFRMYDLRHMHATYSGASGGDPAAIASILGHSDISTTTRVYFQPLEEAKRKSVEAVPRVREDGDTVSKHQERKAKMAGASQRKKKKKKFKIKDIGYIGGDG
ncbi:Tyrosine recombinase XerD [Pseudodesulfovibrio hydrargyri]|uniref:Tyrosine recombinase XerD n=1 Tax=Pseudodesulfovibrio hydrargyri TaxID=2125990 RepID=A0A1J5N695_9BACT|nr:site-specific integrase [Pseudodesulfovibrio hydrargyri]OIQ51139.1 Tyrosine recombinase XerD [Pseudodesulfovibrio hydrargyri]